MAINFVELHLDAQGRKWSVMIVAGEARGNGHHLIWTRDKHLRNITGALPEAAIRFEIEARGLPLDNWPEH